MEVENLDDNQGWGNILKLILPYFFIVGIFQLIGYYFSGLDIDDSKDIHKTPTQAFIVAFLTLIGNFIVIWLFMKFVDKKPFSSLGFERGDIWKDILKGFVFGFCQIQRFLH